MGAGMGGLGPYGPFVALDRMAAQTQGLNLANQLTQGQLGGQAVLGRAMMDPSFGGSTGYNPATPQPGQASQPLQITPNGVTGIPGAQPMPPDPAQPISIPPMPSSPVGGAQAASAGGMPAQQPVSLTGADATQALAGQGAPSGQPGAPGQPPSGTGAPGQQQVLSLDKVLGSIVKANPKASPSQIYNAAALYLPFMQEQDQALLRQALYQTRAYGIDVGSQTKLEVADKQAAAKLEATNIVTGAKQQIAADRESGRSADRAQRAQEFVARETRLGNTATANQAIALQNAITRAESTIDNSALLEGQDPTQAAAVVKQAQDQIRVLQGQLDTLIGQGGGATNAPLGKAPNITTLKTRVVPGASAPLPAGGFQ